MRKLLLLTLLLITLTACADGTALQTVPAPLLDPAPQPLEYVVEAVRHESTAQAPDGTKLAEISLALPELTVLRADGTEIVLPQTDEEKTALAAAETFNKQFQEWASEVSFAELTQCAKEDYALRPEFFTGGSYYTEELAASFYQTENLISVTGKYYAFTGGAHPNMVLLGWNFNLTTGTFLDVTTLSLDVGDFLTAVTDEIVAQIEGAAAECGAPPEQLYWENYREIAAQWSSYAVSFDDAGMTVGFSPYELACYAAGPQEFTLSYDTLRPWLSQQGLQLLGLEEK
ncbi:MAG: DUF3298 domain-containing protein [Oscillibacter sp.]